jgi:hypothetical protein
MPLRVNFFVWQLVYASKNTFFLTQRALQYKLGSKISDKIKRIVTRGRAEKGKKSFTYYLNSPLCV